MNWLWDNALGISTGGALFGVGVFLAALLGSLAVVAFVLIRIPAQYFHSGYKRADSWRERHPIVRWTLVVAKNLLGVALVIVGILLSLPGIPGQGILTILLGIMLIDIPGRRRWERRLVSMPRVRRAIDAIRARFGKPPLILDKREPPP